MKSAITTKIVNNAGFSYTDSFFLNLSVSSACLLLRYAPSAKYGH